MIYFTADQHFCHGRIIEYCHRPFKSVDEMDEEILLRYNSVVNNTDTCYFLGDLGWGRGLPKILEQLKGRKMLLLGGHDKAVYPGFQTLGRLITLKDNPHPPIILCHFAMRVWDQSHYGSWHLYGHSHGRLPQWGKSLDVGVDSHDFFPWSLAQIKEEMEKRPINPDLVESNGDSIKKNG